MQHSAETGDLDIRSSEQLSGALDTSQLTVGEIAAAADIVFGPGKSLSSRNHVRDSSYGIG